MFTASSVFLKCLSDTGITHVFVNWGSDHPALLEDLERQRFADGNGRQETKPKIVTCPNEMVALSAAQGYAQVTGVPAAVIVHVDVGTQALAGAIHNVDRSRTPVVIYAGASPFSTENEHRGTRNEWIMWIQDVPDQAAIVRQYMRYTAQLNSAITIPQTVRRSIQIATSDPKGPVYLWSRREVMEQEVDPTRVANTSIEKWPSVEPTALSNTAASRIASALLTAQLPLIITSHLGRNTFAISPLLTLSTLLSIPLVPVCPSVLSVPASHPFSCPPTFLFPGSHSHYLSKADVILVIESDLPWIPANDRPNETARVFVVDGGDPLKTSMAMGWWHVDAEMVCRADAEVALSQIVDSLRELDGDGLVMGSEEVKRRGKKLKSEYERRIENMDADELSFPVTLSLSSSPVEDLSFTVPNVMGVLRDAIQVFTPSRGRRTLVLNESISNYQLVWERMRPDVPGSMISSGGSSLGWALGAAVGASLGAEVSGKPYELIVAIVGDGSFMFGVPSSAYWMAMKYNTPFLTIILNNGGWKSPKLSMLAVHPDGHGSRAPGDQLSVGFGPVCPDYSQIAVAASGGLAWGKRVGGAGFGFGEDGGRAVLERIISEAVKVVLEEKRCAVVDCVLEVI